MNPVESYGKNVEKWVLKANTSTPTKMMFCTSAICC